MNLYFTFAYINKDFLFAKILLFRVNSFLIEMFIYCFSFFFSEFEGWREIVSTDSEGLWKEGETDNY